MQSNLYCPDGHDERLQVLHRYLLDVPPHLPDLRADKVPAGTLETVIETLSKYTYRMVVQGTDLYIFQSQTMMGQTGWVATVLTAVFALKA